MTNSLISESSRRYSLKTLLKGKVVKTVVFMYKCIQKLM